MSSLNISRAIIAGHLVRDPELKMTPTGVPCTTVTVAVSRKSESAEESVTDFHTVIAWRNSAEFICRFFKKGSAIYIDGKLRLRSYTDKNGAVRKVPEIIANDVSFVDSKSTPPPEALEQPQAFTTAAPPEIAAELNNGTDDDLPF